MSDSKEPISDLILTDRREVKEMNFRINGRNKVYRSGTYWADLISVNDGNNEIYLPYFYSPHQDTLNKLAQTTETMEVSDQTITRIEYSRRVLKLPTALCVYAGFNSDIDLSEFKVPEENIQPSLLVGITGRINSGKSTIAALAGSGFAVYSMDPFVDKNLNKYLQALDKLDAKSPEEKLAALKSISKEKTEIENPDETFKQQLDKLLVLFKEGDRPEIILVDCPGYDVEGVKQRPYDIYDLWAEHASDVFVRTDITETPKDSDLLDLVDQFIESKDLFRQYIPIHEGLISGILATNS